MSEKGAGFLKKVFGKKQRSQETIANFHTTIIRVDDNFISTSSIMLDHALTGNIYSMKEAIIAPLGELKGNITSEGAVVAGRVSGDIICMDNANILRTAVVSGDIRARTITIEPGAVINGSVNIDVNIDNRDLLAKIQQRIPVAAKTEIPLTPALSLETASAKSELRPAETGKRTQAKRAKQPEVVAENHGGGWY